MLEEVREILSPTSDEQAFARKLEDHLSVVYPEQYQQIAQRILERIKQYLPGIERSNRELWSEQDVLLITYGDSIVDDNEHPLKTLDRFLNYYLAQTFNIVHVLPFFPYSSDDGFSVIDYKQVNPALGDWEDIRRLSHDCRLMVDLVINHISRESLWFSDYIANQVPARDYFIELPPDTDTSQVTRPRNSPLLVPVNTHRGLKHVWATFSSDQIDLNFANPDVLVEMLDVLLFYLSNGARLIRLDAIAFLWKRLGTACIHLKETHEVVKLIRDVMSYVAPDCILLTETNVPHEENLSYFGDGDEAHMVYQFSLPPLTLHALNKGTAKHLTQWAQSLPVLHSGCTYLNFTASHDGVGLRALEGILPEHEVSDLVECMHRFGGFVSMKSNVNGKDSPYEVNISLFDAMQGTTRRGPDQWQVQRFICSQAIMLGMQGIPAVYIHSILATPNDLHGVETTGRTRSINRKNWTYEELRDLLDSHNTPNHEVFTEMKRIVAVRKNEPCFHPDVNQVCLDIDSPIFAILRGSDTDQPLLCLYNVTALHQDIDIDAFPLNLQSTQWTDLVEGMQVEKEATSITLRPYQFVWLKANKR